MQRNESTMAADLADRQSQPLTGSAPTQVMHPDYVLPLADPRALLVTVGGKGASLARLAAAGLPVPDGFHVTTAAYQQFVSENNLLPGIRAALVGVDRARPTSLEHAAQAIQRLFCQATMPAPIAEAIAEAYVGLPGEPPVVAVRSSATAEDLPELSFAGQQETFLNVQGAVALQEAVQRCWASLWTARAIGYRLQHGVDQEAVRLAVVVQLLVNADASGILFTANPLNGRRDQAMISAAWGLGEAIVSGQVTPDTLIVEKASGNIVQRQTADKQVMTARTDEGTEERATPADLRHAPALNDQRAAELVRLGVQIEAMYQMPMDIEWALAQGNLVILQARPITALPEPEADVPNAWVLPDPKGKYLRNNIVELMPNPLTPLFATLGRASINRGMQRTMTTFLGKPGLTPDELIVTINGYAYYNGAFTPGQIWQILIRSFGIMRRMLRGMEERWRDEARPAYRATVARWRTKDQQGLAATELLNGVHELMDASVDHYTALVSGIIPAAWISEGLFTKVYQWLIKRRDDPSAPTYLMGYDSLPIVAEKQLYDLAQWCRTEPTLAQYLLQSPAAQLTLQLDSQAVPAPVAPAVWAEWQQRFGAYLEQFGHTIYDLDFAAPTPADAPAPLLETCKLFISGQGADPHLRQ